MVSSTQIQPNGVVTFNCSLPRFINSASSPMECILNGSAWHGTKRAECIGIE